MHVITAIIGAGVLSLPAAMVPLGYAGGSICFLLFGLITLYTAHLLSDTYCINGLRQRTYTALVDTVFGRKGGDRGRVDPAGQPDPHGVALPDPGSQDDGRARQGGCS